MSIWTRLTQETPLYYYEYLSTDDVRVFETHFPEHCTNIIEVDNETPTTLLQLLDTRLVSSSDSVTWVIFLRAVSKMTGAIELMSSYMVHFADLPTKREDATHHFINSEILTLGKTHEVPSEIRDTAHRQALADFWTMLQRRFSKNPLVFSDQFVEQGLEYLDSRAPSDRGRFLMIVSDDLVRKVEYKTAGTDSIAFYRVAVGWYTPNENTEIKHILEGYCLHQDLCNQVDRIKNTTTDNTDMKLLFQDNSYLVLFKRGTSVPKLN